MKKLLITIWGFFALNLTNAQTNNRAVYVSLNPEKSIAYDSLFYANDWRVEWYKMMSDGYKRANLEFDLGKDWMNKMLKIGDKMPDIGLGELLKYNIKERKFGDYQGKIIILDFWNTSCKACIEGFPKMMELQKKFGDKIQIILVNTLQNKQEIETKMGTRIGQLPNLPSIVNARHLIPYFPHRGVPYHVWIDQYGVVRIIGQAYNTYEGKIQDLLNGAPVTSLSSEATRPAFDPNLPYYKLIKHEIDPKAYNSFFTSFNRDYQPSGDSYQTFKADNLNNTIRNTFINWTIGDLYLQQLKAKPKVDGVLWSYYNSNPIYEVKDSLRYDFKLSPLRSVDTARLKSQFCYEQVFPKNFKADYINKLMLEDLNCFFGSMYGTSGRMEIREVPALFVTRLSNNKYRRLASMHNSLGKKLVVRNGRNFVQVTTSLIELPYQLDKLFKNKEILINQTDVDSSQLFDFEIPENASLVEINSAIKSYGLNLIRRNTKTDVFVISDTKAK